MNELNTLDEAMEVLKGIEDGKVIEVKISEKWFYCDGITKHSNLPNFYSCEYRVKPEPKMIPLDRGDIILGKTIVRRKEEGVERLVLNRSRTGIETDVFFLLYKDAQKELEYSNDNGETWKRCEKEGV